MKGKKVLIGNLNYFASLGPSQFSMEMLCTSSNISPSIMTFAVFSRNSTLMPVN
jgi:hypothetical protein